MSLTNKFALQTLPITIAACIATLSVSPVSFAQTSTFSVLYTFSGGTDGGFPNSPVIQDAAGNLYGTTILGGDLSCGEGNPTNGCGVVFKLSSTGTETPLFNFELTSGGNSSGGLKQDAQGNLYGTTSGADVYAGGTVFKISPQGTETILYSFPVALTGTGFNPLAGLVGDPQGNLYGTTFNGGANRASNGVVFRLGPAGKYTVFHYFQGPDGAFPESGLIRDSNGNLYGAANSGGADNQGTVFKIDATGMFTLLHSFSGSDGSSPSSSTMIMDNAGNLYGITPEGGATGNGVVFKVSAGGTFSVLYSFRGGHDASLPIGKLALSPSGLYLFGASRYGGVSQVGTIFAINTSTGDEQVLYSFTGLADGSAPLSGVLGMPGGNGTYELFGTASSGGAGTNCFQTSCGTVFELTITP